MMSTVINGPLPIDYEKKHFNSINETERAINLIASKYIISATLTLCVGLVQVHFLTLTILYLRISS